MENVNFSTKEYDDGKVGGIDATVEGSTDIVGATLAYGLGRDVRLGTNDGCEEGVGLVIIDGWDDIDGDILGVQKLGSTMAYANSSLAVNPSIPRSTTLLTFSRLPALFEETRTVTKA